MKKKPDVISPSEIWDRLYGEGISLPGSTVTDAGPGSRLSTIVIVCGNCAGDDDSLPRKTEQRRDGRCSRCGSRSYELAAVMQDQAPAKRFFWRKHERQSTN